MVSRDMAMYAEHLRQAVRETIEPILGALGFSLVELSVGRRRGVTVVSVVIHRREGVGVEDCATVSNALLPRLETLPEMTDVRLEVSSPGTERTLRSPEEYAIFAGRGVRILSGDETEWRHGIIEGVEGGTLWLRQGTEKHAFALAGIRRARLDFSAEVEGNQNAV